MEKIKGVIKKILFFDETTQFSIFILSMKDQEISANGKFPFKEKITGIRIELEGEWKEHKKYGKGFVFQTANILSSNKTKLFLENFIKGIPQKALDEIFEKYEEKEVIDILDNRPEELMKFNGIKSAMLEKIKKTWQEHRKLKYVSDALEGVKLSKFLLSKIEETLTQEQIKLIRKNPYVLTIVDGIGFKKADEIANQLGIVKSSNARVIAAIMYVTDILIERGSSVLNYQDMVKNVQAITTFEDQSFRTVVITEHQIKACFDALIKKGHLKEVSDDQYTKKTVEDEERFILQSLKNRNSIESKEIMSPKKLEKWIKDKEKFYGISLSDQQKEALRVINSGVHVFALSGYAGTGKSTVSKLILELIEYKSFFGQGIKKEEVVCCALSGIATDRIRNATKRDSMTIASMLIQFSMNKLSDKKVFLIDECSMINTEMMFDLLKNIPKYAKIVFVGDPAQLPPIGAGAPFSDIVSLGLAKNVELTKIYRQSEDAVITAFANEIRKAKVPEKIDGDYDDFKWMDYSLEEIEGEIDYRWASQAKQRNRMSIQHAMSQLAYSELSNMREKVIQRDWLGYIKSFQIISPIKKGELGVNKLNEICQFINSESEENKKSVFFNYQNKKLYRFDKVVHTKNETMKFITTEEMKGGPKVFEKIKGQDVRVNNGMLGVVSFITKKNVYVYYPVENIHVRYKYMDAAQLLDLGYVLTVHKTQGAEFEKVIIPVVDAHKIMLNNKLMYTGITRAKSHITLIGEKDALEYACTNEGDGKRTTYLQFLAKKG